MAFELILGFILAALFVLAYLGIRRLWTGGDRELTGNSPNISLGPAESGNAIGSGSAPRELAAPQNGHRDRH